METQEDKKKTLDEIIFDILKEFKVAGSKKELKVCSNKKFPLFEKYSKKETLLIYELWTCYKRNAPAEYDWRAKYFKDVVDGTPCDKWHDFYAMFCDIQEIMPRISTRSKTKAYTLNEGLNQAQGVENLKKDFAHWMRKKARYRELRSAYDYNIDIDELDNIIDFSKYPEYAIASAGALLSYRASVESKEDERDKKRHYNSIMWFCGQTIHHQVNSILDYADEVSNKNRIASNDEKITIKTSDDMIGVLQACIAKANEWNQTITQLREENKILQNLVMTAKNKKDEKENKKDDEVVWRSYYITFLTKLLEVADRTVREEDKKSVGLLLQSFTRHEQLPPEIDEHITNFHSPQKPIDAISIYKGLLDQGYPLPNLIINQLNIGNGTQIPQLPSPEDNK